MNEKKTSFELQIHLVQDLIDRLHRLNQNLEKVQKAYGQKMEQMKQAGLMSNYVTRFRKDKQEAVHDSINTITQQIEKNDIRYLEIIRDKLQREADKE